jgi:hypothetical protein
MKIYTDELVKRQHLKAGNQLPTDPHSFYSFVSSSQTEPARNRIENWIDEFPGLVASKDFINSIRHERSHDQAVAQLVTGVALRRHSIPIEPNKNIDGKTPDWFVPGRLEHSAFIVEVTTINPPPSMQTTLNRVASFLNSIRSLKAGVTLKISKIVETADINFDPSEQKRYVWLIRNWLSAKPPVGSSFDVAGFQFLIEAWHPTSNTVTTKGWGRSQHANPTRFANPIEEKVSRYKSIIEKYSFPFWIAIQVDDQVPLRFEFLTEMLSGRRGSLSQKEAALPIQRVRHILSPNNKGLFEELPLLSGVLWIENNYITNSWKVAPIYNPYAQNKLPEGTLKEVRFLPIWLRKFCRPERLPNSNDHHMRYFLLFWTAKFPVPGNPNVTGYSKSQRSFMSETFPSQDEVIADIRKTHPTYENISITNLVELSAEDYFNWISEDRRHLAARYESDVIISFD